MNRTAAWLVVALASTASLGCGSSPPAKPPMEADPPKPPPPPPPSAPETPTDCAPERARISDGKASSLLSLGKCLEQSSKLVEALQADQKALARGIEEKDAETMTAARAVVKSLLERIPHVTFVVPPGVTDLWVTFDRREVPSDALSKKFSVDPGTHRVEAAGVTGGKVVKYDASLTLQERGFEIVRIALKP